ncbi:signal peptidase I [archaeon D22]|nr:signal peptidase I [archaeon D22]
MKKNDLKQAWIKLKKFWDFVWNDDSALSWVLNIIVAVVLIKFIIYPVLGFVLATPYPIVAVVSGSMEHDGNFDQFWGEQGLFYEKKDYRIGKEEFRDFPFHNGFNTGDIMILYGTKPENLKIGDVLVFQGARENPKAYPIIHRIIKIENTSQGLVFETKGDHNVNLINSCESFGRDCVFESDIREEQILGKAIIRIPYLGWVKIGAFEAVQKVRSLLFN